MMLLEAISTFWWVIVILVFGAIVLTAVRALEWHNLRKRSRLRREQQKHGPDGEPYPPAGQGLCDSCQRPHDKVYFLPAGQRLCPDCFEKSQQN